MWPSANCKRPRRFVPRLRLGVDLRRGFREHRGGAAEPPIRTRVHQLRLPEPVGGIRLGPLVLARPVCDVPEDEAFVPGSLNRVISGGVAVNPPAGVRQGPFAGFRLRHFGPRPLIEDASVKSKSTTIFNGEVGYKLSENIRLTLEGYNLLDAEVSDIDYFFESRLRDEPALVEDLHFHAAIPRSARLSLRFRSKGAEFGAYGLRRQVVSSFDMPRWGDGGSSDADRCQRLGAGSVRARGVRVTSPHLPADTKWNST